MAEDHKDEKVTPGDVPQDFEKYLEDRQKMDALFKDKFTKRVTIMFTDLKGSTSIAAKEGDLSSRLLIKQHNDIVFPTIAASNGVLVKTMGDGTLSYFESAQDGIRAATRILAACDAFNVREKPKTPILMRIGLHTGDCIVEKNDVFGDVVNVASRFETTANPGEAYFSEDTYNALTDKSEIYCRFVKTAMMKGRDEPFRVYKAFWNKDEIAADKAGEKAAGEKPEATAQKKLHPAVKLAIMIVVPLIVILLIVFSGKIFRKAVPDVETRSVTHSAGAPAEPSTKP